MNEETKKQINEKYQRALQRGQERQNMLPKDGKVFGSVEQRGLTAARQ